jgi:hypothetical protein
MPYKQITQLPDSVKNNLPKGAQEIYKEAINSAEEQYGEEDRAHRVASFDQPSNMLQMSVLFAEGKCFYTSMEENGVASGGVSHCAEVSAARPCGRGAEQSEESEPLEGVLSELRPNDTPSL